MIELQFGFMSVVLLAGLLLAASLRVLREYQRGVVFQLGRFKKVGGPGLLPLFPGIQQMVRVDLRTVTLEIPEGLWAYDLAVHCPGDLGSGDPAAGDPAASDLAVLEFEAVPNVLA